MALKPAEAISPLTPEVEARLETHPWPGNVRELKNVVERAVYRAAGNLVDAVCFDLHIALHTRTDPGAHPCRACTRRTQGRRTVRGKFHGIRRKL